MSTARGPLPKRALKRVAQLTLGRLPPPSGRLTGTLAIDGGLPVRDVRLRPWPTGPAAGLRRWLTSVEPALRKVFLSREEGLPQSLQRRFAERWAEYCGCDHALLLPHGTDALRFALAAAFDHDGLDYGGEVVVPNLSFVASATAPLDRRFGIALVDVDPGTLNLDPRRVEEAIVPGRTRAVLPVHQFGHPADMSALRAMAEAHGLKVIEDAAQAHGAVWRGKPVGSLGDAAAFSFQSAKNLSCGEGGILTTSDAEIFARAYSLHNAGRTMEDGSRWQHASLGWNCRPTEYQAALLLERLDTFEQEQEHRAGNFERLRELFTDIECLRPLELAPGVERHGMYMFALRYHAERCGDRPIGELLEATGAEGAPIYRCYDSTLSEQPALKALADRRPEYVRALPTPVADRAAQSTVYVPSTVFLGDEADMQDIAHAVSKVERHFRQGEGGADR